MVKSERFTNLQLLHHNVRGAIGEGPFFIRIEPFEDFPGLFTKCFRNLLDVEDAYTRHLFDGAVEIYRFLVANVQQQQGVRLIQHIICGNQNTSSGDLVLELKGLIVMGIISILNGAPGTGIHKNALHDDFFP